MNVGRRAGKETVLLYSSDVYASISPDVKRLRRYEKIQLEPGEEKTVRFDLSDKDLAFVNTKNEWVTEPGAFELSIGNQKNTITYVH
jgi:beta-glucosidase